ncbi:MAG: glycosyltransferase [Desulfovibrio sp.]|jgi:glycosyltransferase involved in cell wall biosynthesis|nr:glycosyltransferase [Desulfovibrio sp.]
MKSCLFIMHSFGGGAEKVALQLAQYLHLRNYRITLACVRHIPALARHAPVDVPLYMPAKPGKWAALRNILHIRRLARCSDAVLGSLELQSIFWAALFAPGRALGWLHKDIAGYLTQKGKFYGWLYRHLLGLALRRCRIIVCVSKGIMKSSACLWPDLNACLRLLWNPVDIEGIRTCTAFPLPDGLRPIFTKPVVLGVGRLEEQKAFHLLLEAHAILLARGLDCHCCILGEGSQRTLLEDKIRRLGLEGKAFLPGFMEPYQAMAQACVLALSSLYEGSPLVIVEALSIGLQIVAVDCPSGLKEILNKEKYGVLVPMGDTAALAQALEEVLHAVPDATAKVARMARAEKFALQPALEAWTNTLMTIVPDTPQPPPG